MQNVLTLWNIAMVSLGDGMSTVKAGRPLKPRVNRNPEPATSESQREDNPDDPATIGETFGQREDSTDDSTNIDGWARWPEDILQGDLSYEEPPSTLPDVGSAIAGKGPFFIRSNGIVIKSISTLLEAGTDHAKSRKIHIPSSTTNSTSLENTTSVEDATNLDGAANTDGPSSTDGTADTEGAEVNWDESIVVLAEDLGLPTRELVKLVNTVYAVLVVRVEDDPRRGREYFYHYLKNDFALSAEEEASLVEWGLGRAFLAPIILAVGGSLMVQMAHLWHPALVGTLLVTAVYYRIQGAMTKLIRVMKDKRKHHLIPSGMHGTERAAQFILIAFLAAAEIVESRTLLLGVLWATTLKVVVLECLWQWKTWGLYVLLKGVALRLLSTAFPVVCWMLYSMVSFLERRFIPVYGLGVILLHSPCCLRIANNIHKNCRWLMLRLLSLIMPSLGFYLIYFLQDKDEIDEILNWQYLRSSWTPWEWALVQAPDDIFSALDLLGLWLILFGHCVVALHVVISVFTLKLSSDRWTDNKLLGQRRIRARARKNLEEFLHWDDPDGHESIPSRHVFHGLDGSDKKYL